jgi:putative ABC transport system substrate-binding protein
MPAFLVVLFLFSAHQAVAGAKTIGLILPRDCAVGTEAKDEIMKHLMDEGFSSKDVEVFVQRPAPDKVSRLNSVRKFLSFGADAIVIWGGTAVPEAAREAGKTSIIFLGVYDPIKEGVVKDLNAPGKNVTGVSARTSMTFLLDNILEVMKIETLGVIYHSGIPASTVQLEELNAIAPGKGMDVISLDAAKGGLDKAQSLLAPAPFLYLAQGCYVEDGQFANLAKLEKPAATQTPGVTGGGVVFTLAPDPDTLLKEASGILARILKGEKAGKIPVSRVKKIEFTINLGEAKRMGLKVPFPVLSRGTEVIK